MAMWTLKIGVKEAEVRHHLFDSPNPKTRPCTSVMATMSAVRMKPPAAPRPKSWLLRASVYR